MATGYALEEKRRDIRLLLVSAIPTEFGLEQSERDRNTESSTRLFDRAQYLCLIPVNEVVLTLNGSFGHASLFYDFVKADGLLRYETMCFAYGMSKDSHIASIGVATIEEYASYYGVASAVLANLVKHLVFKKFIDEFESISDRNKIIRMVTECPDAKDSLVYSGRVAHGVDPDYDSFAPLLRIRGNINYNPQNPLNVFSSTVDEEDLLLSKKACSDKTLKKLESHFQAEREKEKILPLENSYDQPTPEVDDEEEV